ncbi:MAG: OmpA family protein [Candidatus Krumholzibacteriia bacterium]
MRSLFVILLVVCVTVGLAACGGTKQKQGTVVGAGVGAAAGAVVGNVAGNTAVGAIVGAVVGGAAGAHIGKYMDEQAAEMERDLEGARIERVGEGIRVTFDSGLLFAVDRAVLEPQAEANLRDLATILEKYDDTNILIEGHTDSTGPEAYNQELSERRADAVAHYLAQLGVDSSRFSVAGYGEMQPVASNATVAGRQENRRVELAIIANDELKEVAERRAG